MVIRARLDVTVHSSPDWTMDLSFDVRNYLARTAKKIHLVLRHRPHVRAQKAGHLAYKQSRR